MFALISIIGFLAATCLAYKFIEKTPLGRSDDLIMTSVCLFGAVMIGMAWYVSLPVMIVAYYIHSNRKTPS